MRLDTPDIKKAKEFALKHHGNQKYGKKPYMYHLEGVANKVDDVLDDFNIPTNDEETEHLLIIALLHDVVEDTDVTSEELMEEFGLSIAFQVEMLTHIDTYSYLEYILNLKTLASMIVKIADLRFNRAESEKEYAAKSNNRKKQMIAKYQMAEYIVGNNLEKLLEE